MIIVDIETTGVDPEKNSIVSIGAVNFDFPDNQFYEECRIWDGAIIEPQALVVNGFSEEEILNTHKKSEAEIVKEFFDWLDIQTDEVIAGQNVFFDCDFLRSAVKRSHGVSKITRRIIDLHSITYFHMIRRGITPPILNKKTNLDSDKVMEYVGLPAEPKPHKALNGAIYEAEAFSRLMRNKVLFSEFEKYPLPWQ